MSLEPQAASEALSADLVAEWPVVERVALRLFAGKADIDVANPKARKWWRVAIDEEDRESWRRHARALLADIALGDQGEMPVSREYEVRHDEHGLRAFDDVGDAVDFSDHVWPGSKVFERTRVPVRGEWTEVTS